MFLFYIVKVLLNRNFHIPKISHRENWYQIFTACEKLVPICHVFIQIFHICKICARSKIICSIHAHSSHR